MGDVITEINGMPVLHYMQFNALLKDKPEQVTLTLERNNAKIESKLIILYSDKGIPELGINWKTETFVIPGTGFLTSIENGFIETWKTLALTIKSIGLLFRGVDLTEAVSGPVRITMMIGEIAQTSFIGVAQLLSIICVSLFLMNLLPIPILDGGMILFSLIEMIYRKPLKPKTLYYVQFIGIAFIGFMFIFALFGDIRYLMK
jgi:regulator of sigma E protease